MKSITLRANAKVNLTLAVTGKRDDGYHTISTVMHSVALFDELTVEKCDFGVCLTTNDENIPTDEKNTAYKAALAFFDAAKIDCGAKITLNKLAPYEAGLGSASADAAGVLLALNKLCGEPLSKEELSAAGLKVGADVPFCLRGGAALCEGIGEIMTPQKPLSKGAFVIVKPAGGVSTAEAYRAVDALEEKMEADNSAVIAALDNGDLKALGKSLNNVFTLCCPVDDVRAIIDEMKTLGALGAEMSGSGSAVFGLFENEEEAKKAAPLLMKNKRKVFTALPAKEGIYFTGE
ncbi:MAG: 4-(cytidine 5'-diphospho)-2-C-methyl-D-erythritol kinase [Oscillospiraceae bacterium]|nr:4-(cytidine 5'-diphospho)-2-C-methyl-D-erythritol kinase [Oscillospiraceae bacterium]